MNLIGLLAGEVVETVGKAAVNKMAQQYKASNDNNYSHWLASAGSKFGNILNEKMDKNQELNLSDLKISPEQRSHILNLRNLATNKGLKTFEIEVDKHKFKVDTASLNLTPVV